MNRVVNALVWGVALLLIAWAVFSVGHGLFSEAPASPWSHEEVVHPAAEEGLPDASVSGWTVTCAGEAWTHPMPTEEHALNMAVLFDLMFEGSCPREFSFE